MKKLFFLIALSLVFTTQSAIFGQKRAPAKPRPAATKIKPAVKEVEETETVAPAPKPRPVAVSPAQAFFNEGLKCAAEDYDCQISNYTKAINLDLKTKEVFKSRGNAYLRRNDFDKAIGDFTKLIELDLNDVNGYKNRGKIYMENAKSPQFVDAAIKDFTSVIDLEPKDVEAYKLRSSAYMKLRNYDKAKADMDKIAAIEPNNIDVVISQGEMFLADKQYDKAIEFLTKAIAVKPTGELYFVRANAYAAQKKYDIAVSDFGKAIELDPKSADAYSARGSAYLQLGKTDLAVQDINKAVGIDPTNLDSSLDLAKYFERKENYDDAIKIYNSVLPSASKEAIPQYLYKRGQLNLLKQDFNAAIADVTKSLEINSQNAKAFELRCKAFYQLKDFKSALEDCSDAVDLDPNLDDAYIYRGIAGAFLTGKLEGQAQNDSDRGYSNSVANANKILTQKPDDFDALVKRATGNYGLKNYAAAFQDYKRVIDINPQYQEAYKQLDYCNHSMNPSYDLATKSFNETAIVQNKAFSLQILTQGILANPESVMLYHLRGLLYFVKDDRSAVNDFDKAIQNYTKKIKPTETEKTYVRLAIDVGAGAYRRLKDETNALATISKCDDFFPDSVACESSKGDFYGGQKSVDAYNRAIELYSLKKTAPFMFSLQKTFYKLAEVYFRLDDKANAVASINKGISLFPNDEEMWTQAAMFYQSVVRDTVKGTEYFNKAAGLGSEIAKQHLNFVAEMEEQKAQWKAEEKQRKKQQRNAAILAVMGAVNQTLETYNTAQQNSQISSPRTPTVTQTNNSGGQTTAQGNTNNSNSQATSTSAKSTGSSQAKRTYRYDISADTSLFDKCTTSPGFAVESCWNNWGSLTSLVQFRVKGPIPRKGNLVNLDPTKTVYYEWNIQSKNTTSYLVCVSFEVTNGDGRKWTYYPCMVPGGTVELRGGENLYTLSPAKTIVIQAKYLDQCTNFEKTGEGNYRCKAWQGESPE